VKLAIGLSLLAFSNGPRQQSDRAFAALQAQSSWNWPAEAINTVPGPA